MSIDGPQERIDTGNDVMGRDDQKLGSVAYVVVRPPELEVTDIVVSTGAILGRDIVVPVRAVERVANGKVYLGIDQEQLKQYPDYIDVHYQAPPAGWVPPAGFYYPPGSVLWPVEGYYPAESSVTVNAPPGTVGLQNGMDVVSSDGHKVGSIDGLEVDPRTDDVVAMIIKHGFLFSSDTYLPVEYVANVRGGTVTLNLTKDEVQHRLEGAKQSKVTGPGEY